jgi:hypothetical protein
MPNIELMLPEQIHVAAVSKEKRVEISEEQ